jgi:putative tryptophan/tyrosine transport system substrate-binding protein
MRRRKFIALLASAAVAWPCAGGAQQTAKVPRVGLLLPGSPAPYPELEAFYETLRELGYTAGQNIAIEPVYAEWKPDRFAELAAELVRRKVDIIFVASTSPARAAQAATSTIPIVVATMADPIADGLVASLARPGGNITGNTFLGPELIGKRFGLLKEAIPGLSRVAALWHPGAYGEATMAGILADTKTAARALEVQLQIVPARDPGDFDDAFAAMTREHAEAMIQLPSPMLFVGHRRIVELAAKSRLPAMYNAREFVEAGGLMAYGANIVELWRRAAGYVDKILKGAKPADLPVEQPTKFEFLINLKTAQALGLTFPPMLLGRADEVIE